MDWIQILHKDIVPYTPVPAHKPLTVFEYMHSSTQSLKY